MYNQLMVVQSDRFGVRTKTNLQTALTAQEVSREQSSNCTVAAGMPEAAESKRGMRNSKGWIERFGSARKAGIASCESMPRSSC